MKDSTPNTPEVISKKDVPSFSMQIACIHNPTVRKRLSTFVKSFDLSQVRDCEGLAMAYQGIFDIAIQLGPENPKILKVSEVAIKALDGFARNRKEFLQIEAPQQVIAQVTEVLKALQGAIEQELTDDQRKKLSPVMRGLIGQLSEEAE